MSGAEAVLHGSIRKSLKDRHDEPQYDSSSGHNINYFKCTSVACLGKGLRTLEKIARCSHLQIRYLLYTSPFIYIKTK